MQLVLLDNTVLSNFALLQRCDLVLSLWKNRCATSFEVIAEYQTGVERGILTADVWSDLTILSLDPAELTLADQLSKQLGAGERTCIAIAVRRRCLFASDDRDARRIAQTYKVPLTGTLGILVAQVRLGRIPLTEGNSILKKLIKLNYHSPVESLEKLV